jgi:hypothetical protein
MSAGPTWGKLGRRLRQGEVRNWRGSGDPPPGVFSEVFILKNFKSNDFGSAHSKGLTGRFFGSADSKELSRDSPGRAAVPLRFFKERVLPGLPEAGPIESSGACAAVLQPARSDIVPRE